MTQRRDRRCGLGHRESVFLEGSAPINDAINDAINDHQDIRSRDEVPVSFRLPRFAMSVEPH